MGWPESRELRIVSLASEGGHAAGKISHLELLGFRGKVRWSQDLEGLKVQLPAEKPGAHAFALKVDGLKLDRL